MLKVDTTDVKRVVLRAAPTSAQLKAAAQQLATASRAEWIRLAQEELRSTTRDYIKGIGDPVFSKGGRAFSITLEGALQNMLENGWPGGDMRAFLDKAPRARRAKDGHLYNVIPFRHGSPGTGGRNVGRPMSKKLFDTASQLKPGDRLDHRKVLDPAVAKIIRKKLASHHAVGQYQGMIKSGGYFTFRVISEAVPRGWIHPGIRARRLAGKVQKYLGVLVPHVIDGIIGKI